VLAETKALPGTIVFDGPRAVEVEGWIAAATGDLARARQRLDAAANQFVDLGDLQNATAAVHGIARLGNADMAADRLEALAREMDGDLAPARAAHAAALAAHDAPALERVARTFGAMGADLYAAEAEAAASIEHRRADRPRDAAAAARRAAVLAARCEGARTPALQGVETRAQLTPTELETARLAAAGHSNREIADRLVVSVRTVENRLYRIYEKLGVPGRGLLARALRDL